MTTPLVSVCIPAFKQVVHLRRTLASIAEQDFKDLETLISDDSPDDQIEKLVGQFADRLPGLRYQRNQTPLGPPANWNKAISMGSAPWIKVLHHDDHFTSSTSLSTFVSATEDPTVGFICSAAKALNETLGTSWLHNPPSAEIERLFRSPHLLFLGNRIGPPSSVMYRRDLGIRFNPAHRFLVDLEFYHDVLVAGAKPVWIPEPLVTSVSGASHNVTRTSFTRDVELKESLELYSSWRDRFTSQDKPALIDQWTALFVRYGVMDAAELSLESDLSTDEVIIKALDRARYRLRLRNLKRRIAGTPLYKLLRSKPTDPAKTSWSQCGEDLIMDHVLGALGITRPFFVDIGAHHPLFLNNTYLFHQRGATGVNIEPDPVLIKAFQQERPKDANLNIGVTAAPDATEETLYVFDQPTLNTFSKEEVDRVIAEQPERRVVATPRIRIENINDVLARYDSDKRIDILSIDVEGLDEQLIRALDLEKHRPLMICLETISYSVTGQGVKNDALIRYVESHGYLVYADTNINTIFVLEHIWRR